MALFSCHRPPAALPSDAGAAERLLVQQDRDLDRRFLLARLLVSLSVGGYTAATALVEAGAASLLGVVAAYALANVGLFLALCPLPGRWLRWSFAGLDVTVVLLLHYSLFLEPLADPNVALAGLLALVLFAYTLYGDMRLTPAMALSAMVTAGATVWLDAFTTLNVDLQEATVQAYSLLATAVMGYLAIAALVSIALALTIHAQRQRHAEAVEAEMEASVQAGVERARRERVQELDQLKLSFIGVLSHELRTPITPLTSALDLVGDDLETQAAATDTREMLDIAREAAAQLERLVHDYTRLAELLTSDPALDEVHNVALDRLVGALLANRPLAEVAVQTNGLEGLVTSADARLLTGALTALLRRAELATESGEPIRIEGCRHESHVTLSIHDADSYVEPPPEENADDLFFSSNERVFHSSSTGLELLLARHSLRRLGGQLHVHSAPEEGTTVTCQLPLPEEDSPLIADESVHLVLQIMG